MKIKLTYWQMLLLFLPGIIGAIVIALPTKTRYDYQTTFSIANLLWVLNVCIVGCYQGYLAINFIKREARKATVFKVNLLIPVAFIIWYLLYVTYLTATNAFHNPKFIPGPLKQADFNYKMWIIFAFLFHGFVNFYFVNNQYVLARIKKINNLPEQEELKKTYWMPMRQLVRTSVWIIAGTMLLSLIIGIAL